MSRDIQNWLALFITVGAIAAGTITVRSWLNPLSVEQRWETVEFGMTQKQVLSIMGPPMIVRRNPYYPEWISNLESPHLCWDDPESPDRAFVVIFNRNDKVKTKLRFPASLIYDP
jgi:hypothetical protein